MDARDIGSIKPPVEMAPETSQSPTDDALNPQVEITMNRASSTTTNPAPNGSDSPVMAGYQKAAGNHHANTHLDFEPATTHVWDNMRFTVDAQNEMKRGEENHTYRIPKVAVIDGGFCKHFPSLDGRILHRRAFDANGNELPDPYTVGPEGCAHGTMCAFLVGGDFDHVDYHGIKMGTGRGGLPSCLLGLYALPVKVTLQSIYSAVMAAINDGYQIISFSFTCMVTIDKNFGTLTSGLYFTAMARGVMLCLPAGNYGSTNPIWNTCPFVFTVTANETKNPVVTEFEVAGAGTIRGPPINLVQHNEFYSLQNAVDAYCMVPGQGLRQLRQDCVGKFCQDILVYRLEDGHKFPDLLHDALKLKARGVVIICSDWALPVQLATNDIAVVSVGKQEGDQILDFIKNNQPGTVKGKIHRSKLEENLSPMLASFCSRLPIYCSNFLFKPEISAPGTDLCVALEVKTPGGQREYGLRGGTSTATPIIAAVIAYLKERHPDWTYAEIRSAIMTCADVFTRYQNFRDRLACGTGIVNPEKADDAPLLYDISAKQYARVIQGESYCDEEMVKKAKIFYDASKDAPEKKCPRNLNLPAFKAVIPLNPQVWEKLTYKRKVRLAGGGEGTFIGEFEYEGCDHEYVELKVYPNKLQFKGKIDYKVHKKERLSYTVEATVLKWNQHDLIYCRLKWKEQGGKRRESMCPIVIDKRVVDIMDE